MANKNSLNLLYDLNMIYCRGEFFSSIGKKIVESLFSNGGQGFWRTEQCAPPSLPSILSVQGGVVKASFPSFEVGKTSQSTYKG